MKTGVIREPIKIGFDPKKASPLVQQVFGDDIAKALWLMVKSTHLVTTGFEEWCLETARTIRIKSPQSPEELHGLIYHRPPFLPNRQPFLSGKWEDSKEWLERLAKAISGESPVEYVVV